MTIKKLNNYIIIWDTIVGKLSLINLWLIQIFQNYFNNPLKIVSKGLRYAHGEFIPEYQLAIGVEFGAKNVQIRNKTYRIQIWDTADQENFRAITSAYYKNRVFALVVYDISSRDSFINVST